MSACYRSGDTSMSGVQTLYLPSRTVLLNVSLNHNIPVSCDKIMAKVTMGASKGEAVKQSHLREVRENGREGIGLAKMLVLVSP